MVEIVTKAEGQGEPPGSAFSARRGCRRTTLRRRGSGAPGEGVRPV